MKEEIDQETKELEENRETNETDLEESVAEDIILSESDKVDDPVEQIEQTGEKEIIDVCRAQDFSPEKLKDILRQRYGG